MFGQADENRCLKANAKSCGECIQAGPNCGWCTNSTCLQEGEPQTFTLKFKWAEDYPMDLYYLMDLSYSMKDDLENVKSLGTDLMSEMRRITSDFRIGRINVAWLFRGESCDALH